MLRVITRFTGVQGSPWFSTIHMDGTDQTSATAANTAVGAFWESVDNYIDNAVLWATESEIESINPVTGETVGAFAVTPVSGSGDAAGDLLPIAAQALVRIRTGVFVGGREIRGRIFVPGVNETYNANGVLEPTAQTGILAAANTLDAAGLLVWSRTHGQAVIASTLSVASDFAVLRSRRD